MSRMWLLKWVFQGAEAASWLYQWLTLETRALSQDAQAALWRVCMRRSRGFPQILPVPLQVTPIKHITRMLSQCIHKFSYSTGQPVRYAIALHLKNNTDTSVKTY